MIAEDIIDNVDVGWLHHAGRDAKNRGSLDVALITARERLLVLAKEMRARSSRATSRCPDP